MVHVKKKKVDTTIVDEVPAHITWYYHGMCTKIQDIEIVLIQKLPYTVRFVSGV